MGKESQIATSLAVSMGVESGTPKEVQERNGFHDKRGSAVRDDAIVSDPWLMVCSMLKAYSSLTANSWDPELWREADDGPIAEYL